MLSTIRYSLLAVLCFVTTFAHGLAARVSDTFPLTDTIYGQSNGAGKLRSDGRQPFLFWLDETNDRLSVARVDGGERVAKLVFPFAVYGDDAFDAVWTGSHFLVVAQSPGYEIVAQLVDSSGDTLGAPFQISENGLWPRLAFNGRNVLLMWSSDGVRTQLLTPSGAPADEPRLLEQALLSWSELLLASNGDSFAAIVPQGSHTPQSLFVLDATGKTVARQTLETPFLPSWALTSNGSRYFAVTAHFSGPSAAYVFEGNGTLVAHVDLQPTAGFQRSYREPAATWTGTRWLFSLYVENGSFTRLFELDADGGDLDLLADRAGIRDMQLTRAGEQPVATWHREGIAFFAGAPLEESTERVLFAARHQDFLASATSSTGTLFVWSDREYWRGALRVGFRTQDGRWTERELITGYGSAVAASDGNGFVVVTSGIDGSRIIRLDANGDPLPGGPVTFTGFEPLAIASNGTGYVVAGSRRQDFVPTGNLLAAHIIGSTVSPARELPVEAGDVVGVDLASDGERYLVSWGVQEDCSARIEFCGAARIAGLFLTGSADVDGPLLRLTEQESSSDHELAWNGREYVLVRNAGGLTASRISRSGVPRGQHVLTTEFVGSISVARAAEGEVAVAWVSNEGARMTVLTEDGPDGQPLTIDTERSNFPWYSADLAALGQGQFAFVFTGTAEAAPIHGRRHVMAKIVAPALPPRPPAPVLTVQDLGATVNLQWTGSPLADGYRVEQRTGDGPWVEIGGWRNPDQRSLTVRSTASPQFRVRAFNEAGAGPYSGPGGRRRAVR